MNLRIGVSDMSIGEPKELGHEHPRIDAYRRAATQILATGTGYKGLAIHADAAIHDDHPDGERPHRVEHERAHQVAAPDYQGADQQ